MNGKINNIMLVPSNDINPVNQISNTKTIKRCEQALKEWKKDKYGFILVSGGCTNGKNVQTISSADIMKEWLISKGVSEDKILSENKSLDTYTNIHCSLKLLQDRGINFQNLTVVSHWAHLIRIRIILWRNYGIKPVCIPVKYKLSFVEWLHEITWFFYHLIDKTGNGFIEKMVRRHITKKASI